jgi:AcrR family transcriptional regulator
MVRPRSTRAHGEVLDAALRLFAKNGIDATSMDAIAESSGVSKATIYKHWPDKETLCLEALATLHGANKPRPVFDSGDLRADLVAALAYQPPLEHSDLRHRLMPHLMAYAVRNPPFGKAWKACVFEPPRLQVRELLQRAIARGCLRRELDLDLSIALLLGPVMYCHILKRMHGEPPLNLPERVVDAFWKAHGIGLAVANPQAPRPRRRSEAT